MSLRHTDDGWFKGSGWRGTRIRRAISSARPRIRRCATGRDIYAVLLSLVY